MSRSSANPYPSEISDRRSVRTISIAKVQKLHHDRLTRPVHKRGKTAAKTSRRVLHTTVELPEQETPDSAKGSRRIIDSNALRLDLKQLPKSRPFTSHQRYATAMDHRIDEEIYQRPSRMNKSDLSVDLDHDPLSAV